MTLLAVDALQLVYSTEKLVSENKAKLDAADIATVEKALAELKEAREGEDLEALRAKIQTVQAESMKIGQAMYKNAGAADAAAASGGAASEDKGNTVDAEFKDKTGDKK